MKRNRRRRLGGGANEEEERKGRPSPSAAPVARRRCSTTVAVSNAARAFACVVVECCCCRCPALGFSFWARWAPNLNRAPRFYFLFLFFFGSSDQVTNFFFGRRGSGGTTWRPASNRTDLFSGLFFFLNHRLGWFFVLVNRRERQSGLTKSWRRGWNRRRRHGARRNGQERRRLLQSQSLAHFLSLILLGCYNHDSLKIWFT